MEFREKCCYWFMFAATVVGIYFGITIFCLFTFYYHNVSAGTWGLVSGLFAAICLHLRLLSRDNRISNWYSPVQLKSLAILGLCSATIACAFTIYYIVYASTHHIPMLPVETSYYLAAVWSFMSMKWSLTLAIASYRFARFIQYTTPFLVIQDQDQDIEHIQQDQQE